MNPTYEQLYDCFAQPLLEEAASYNEEALRQLLARYPLSQKDRYRLQEEFFDRYLQWSGEGFAMGLQTGIRILAEIKFRRQ